MNKEHISSMYLVFIRHNNDLDMLLPLVYFHLQRDSESCVHMINSGVDIFCKDYRVKYVENIMQNRFVYYDNISRFLNNGISGLEVFIQVEKNNAFPLFKNTTIGIEQIAKLHIVKKRSDKYILDAYHKIYDLVIDKLTSMSNGARCTIIVDRIKRARFAMLAHQCKDRGVRLICVQHGARIAANLMIDVSQDSVEAMGDQESRSCYNAADMFFVGHETEAEINIALGISKDRIKILGLPRYYKEWSDILKSITPLAAGIEKKNSSEKIITFLLSSPQKNIWMEEICRSINVASSMANTKVIVVAHPRSKAVPEFNNRNNVFIYKDIPLTYVVDKSDIVFFVVSSAFLEGYLQGKPTYYLRNASANRVVGQLDQKYIVDCRDDIVRIIENIDSIKDEFKNSLSVRKYLTKIVGSKENLNILDQY